MILAVLQARMSSSRLPGKVLKSLLGQPMLARQIERIKRAKSIDNIVVATSTEASDDAIEDFCQAIAQPCFRGDLNNVLSRFYHCAEQYQAAHIIRLTADCPVIDPGLIDEVVKCHLNHQNDYTTNAIPRTYPDGLDVEVMTMTMLRKAYQNANQAEQLEHVTLYIRQHSEHFKLEQLRCPEDLSEQRWTVDHPADFVLVERIFERLYPQYPAFDYHQIMDLYHSEPELFSINQHLIQ